MPSINTVTTRPATRPLGPIPSTKKVGFADVKWSGVAPKFSTTAFQTKIKFSGHATSGGDLASFMQVTLPSNHGGPVRPGEKPTTVTVNFKNKESPTQCAKDLAAALQKKVGAGYLFTAKGSTVTIQKEMLR